MSAARARRRQAAPKPPQHDRGADGPAMLCRPSRPVETAVAGVLATQTLDGHLIDRLHRYGQINDRQYEAALNLLRMCNSAGLEQAGAAQYGRIGHGGDLTDDMAHARAVFNRLLTAAGGQRADLLTSLCHGRMHPGLWHLTATQEALGWLAKRWGMR